MSELDLITKNFTMLYVLASGELASGKFKHIRDPEEWRESLGQLSIHEWVDAQVQTYLSTLEHDSHGRFKS